MKGLQIGESRSACPGFPTYKVLPNLQFEINGEIPVWTPGARDQNHEKLIELWEKYKAPITKYCKRNNVPPAYLVAIAMCESRGNPEACSPCQPGCCGPYSSIKGKGCCAYGMMQFIDLVARYYGKSGPDLIGDSDLAIDLAAQHLGNMMWPPAKTPGKTCAGDYTHPRGRCDGYEYDLPRMAAAYNAGQARCGYTGTLGLRDQHDYAYRALKYANTFIALGLGVSPVREALPYLLAGMAVGGAFGWAASSVFGRR